MAKIRSTMDLVMEKAASIGTATADELREQEGVEQGMRLAGAYLDGKQDALQELLDKQEPALQPAVRKGMIDTLLRNIVLPREDYLQERTGRALQGLMELSGRAGDIVSLGNEIQHIVSQYRQHRSQLRQQLEDQIRMQYEQLLAQQAGGSLRDDVKIDPAMQPKFQEEWGRIQAELDSQYQQALDQHIMVLRQRLG